MQQVKHCNEMLYDNLELCFVLLLAYFLIQVDQYLNMLNLKSKVQSNLLKDFSHHKEHF